MKCNFEQISGACNTITLCMHYKYIGSSCGKKSTCQEDFSNNEMDRCKISKWEVVLGASDKVNIPCLMHDTRICHETKTKQKQRWCSKQAHIYNIYIKSKSNTVHI